MPTSARPNAQKRLIIQSDAKPPSSSRQGNSGADEVDSPVEVGQRLIEAAVKKKLGHGFFFVGRCFALEGHMKQPDVS